MPAPIPVLEQFSEEQKQKVVEWYDDGKTQQEIANLLYVPRRTIMKLCDKLGLHKDHKEAQKSRFAPGFVEDVSKLRLEGKTIPEIATILNRSWSAVHRACKAAQVEKPTPIIQSISIEQLINDYNSNGSTLHTVATKYNTSAWSVKKRLHDACVTLREPLLRRDVIEKTNIVVKLDEFQDTKDWFYGAYITNKYSLTQIARFLCRGIGYVARKLSKYGIKLRTISESLAVLDRHAVLASYSELGSMSKVASRFNCTVQAIKHILLDHDVQPRTASEILTGSGNPFFGKTHPEETRQLCAVIGAVNGAKFWVDHPEYVDVVKAKAAVYWSDLARRAEDSKRISELRAAGKCGSRKGMVASRFGDMFFDSSYECEFIEFCERDDRIVFLERDFALVEYEFEGKRNFVPDFRLWLSNGDFLVVEIKSDWYSKQPKEHQKIVAGFGKFFDKFMVLSQKGDFVEVSHRIDSSFVPVSFSFDDLELHGVGADLYSQFYGLFHYIGKSGRRGPTVGAFLNNRLIAAATIGSITRAEMAKKQGLSQSEMRELVRFCIHPDFHKPNFGSWLLSRVVSEFKSSHKDVKMLVSFADKSHGHAGTIYKAAGWVYDGDTGPSYHYDKDGLVYHKKTIYNLAKGLGVSERGYADQFGFRRVSELPKARFLLAL